MKRKGILSVLFVMLAAGCTNLGQDANNPQLTVAPYEVNSQEEKLISKTGTKTINYFKLNGKLDEGEVVAYAMETYKKGEKIGDEVKSWGDADEAFKDEIISFGISVIGSNRGDLNIMLGVPSGWVLEERRDAFSASTFCKTIHGKVTLEKDKPAYLAMWKGTDADSQSCSTTEDGGLPNNLDEADAAYVYKILWTDEEKVN